MKHLAVITLSLFFALLLTSCGTANRVYYTHKALAAEGCTVFYYAMVEKKVPKIIASVRSDRLVFSKEPELLIKTFDGDIIALNGEALDVTSQTSGSGSGGDMFVSSSIVAMAQFPIRNEDIALLEKGVSKIRLSTVPIVHEKEFRSDKIGKPLFRMFQKLLAKDNSF